MPDRTQEIKNLRAVAVASKNYTDKVAKDLQWQLGTYDLSVDTNTNTAHIKQLPSGTIQTTVAKVEGVGYKVNQMNNLTNNTYTENGITFTITDYIMFISGTASANASWYNYNPVIRALAGKKVLVVFNSKTGVSFTNVGTSSAIITPSSANNYGFAVASGTDLTTPYSSYLNVFDLTADFGSGNEPSTVSDCYTAYLQRGINIYEYTPQQSSIKNNAFTGVKVDGTNLFDDNYDDYTRPNDYLIYPIDLIKGQTYSLFATLTGSAISGCVIGIVPYGRKYADFQNVLTNIVVNSGGAITYRRFTPDETWTSPKLVVYAGSKTAFEELFNTYKVMLNVGSSILSYTPYIQPTTISVDLTQIKDSNNNSLFPSGKLMGNSNVADFITPYNQESRWNEKDFSTLTFVYLSNYGVWRADLLDVKNRGNAIATNYVYNDVNPSLINEGEFTLYYSWYGATPSVFVKNGSSTTPPTGILQYERATYLTSNTDLTALTRIDCQSNGTITLNNTDNVDMPNTIDYLIEEVKA